MVLLLLLLLSSSSSSSSGQAKNTRFREVPKPSLFKTRRLNSIPAQTKGTVPTMKIDMSLMFSAVSDAGSLEDDEGEYDEVDFNRELRL